MYGYTDGDAEDTYAAGGGPPRVVKKSGVYNPPRGFRPRKPEDLVVEWLGKHPAGRLAYELYITGEESSIPKAAKRAYSQIPDDITIGSIVAAGRRHGWELVRDANVNTVKARVENVSLNISREAAQQVSEMRAQMQATKPGGPRDSREELAFLTELREVWRANAKEERDGTKAVNWLKALKELEIQIQALTSDVADDEADDTDYEAIAQAAQDYKPQLPPIIDPNSPQGREHAFLSEIEKQYREHQKALEEGEKP